MNVPQSKAILVQTTSFVNLMGLSPLDIMGYSCYTPRTTLGNFSSLNWRSNERK